MGFPTKLGPQIMLESVLEILKCPQLTPERVPKVSTIPSESVLKNTKLSTLITGRMHNHKTVCD